MWHIWLIVAGVFFILETVTTGFFVFWLGVAALLALLVSFIAPTSILLQITVFILSSIALIILTKPLVNKLISNKETVATNANAIIGKTALVTEDINSLESTGQIKVGGEIWSAKTVDSNIIPKGANVEICSIEGVKACVKLASKNKFSNSTNV